MKVSVGDTGRIRIDLDEKDVDWGLYLSSRPLSRDASLSLGKDAAKELCEKLQELLKAAS